MNSVNHYRDEIKNLEKAKEVTESTLKDLVDSFIEFVPFKAGDVLIIKDKVMKVDKVNGINNYSSGLTISLNVHYPNSYGGYNNNCNGERITFKELDEIKIVYSKPDEQ